MNERRKEGRKEGNKGGKKGTREGMTKGGEKDLNKARPSKTMKTCLLFHWENTNN